jgi:hypothetical protein
MIQFLLPVKHILTLGKRLLGKDSSIQCSPLPGEEKKPILVLVRAKCR